MADFRCVTSTISTIKDTLEEVQNILTDTLTQVRNVQGILQAPENWQGEAQLVGAAFMDLVMQYHEKLESGEGGGPVSEAIDSLQEYLDNDSVFYDEWEDYRELSNI